MDSSCRRIELFVKSLPLPDVKILSDIRPLVPLSLKLFPELDAVVRAVREYGERRKAHARPSNCEYNLSLTLQAVANND